MDVTAHLLESGAMVDHQEVTKGWTALIWAAKRGNLATVQTLIERGADPSLRDFSGRTAAHWPQETGHSKIVEALSIKQFQQAPRADR